MKPQHLNNKVTQWMKRTGKDFSRGRTGGRETPDKAKEMFRRQPYAKGDKDGGNDKFSGGDVLRGDGADNVGRPGP